MINLKYDYLYNIILLYNDISYYVIHLLYI